MEKRFKDTVVFLVGTLLITWALYAPIPLLGLSPYTGPGLVLLFFGGSAPSWFGVIMALVTYTAEQRRDYLQRAYQVRRINPAWWLILVFLFPIIIAASIGLDVAFGGVLPGMANLKAVISNPLLWFPLIGLSFMSGPFSEELGWRGFALDPLLERFGFTKGNTILGLIWGVWHLPLFFMAETWHGRIGFGLSGFWTFMLMSISLSFIMSWVFVNTDRSTLTGMLLHLSSNFSAQLVAGADGMTTPRLEVFKGLLIAVVGIGIALYMTMAKKDAASNYSLPAKPQATIAGGKGAAV